MQGRGAGTPWGLAAIGLIGLAALMAVIVTGLYATLPKSTPGVSLPASPTRTMTLTQASTATITLTLRPTWTLRPSDTRTITPTPTITQTPTPVLIATLNAARPYRYNDRYSLRSYTPEMADEFASRMRQAPKERFSGEARTSSEYYAYFRYAVIAYREALLRFPQDWRVESWQWGLTYALAMTGDLQAVESYVSFFRQALETPGRQVTDLPDWLKEHDPDLTLTVQPLDTRPGSLERALLELQPGGVFFYYERTPNNRNLWALTNRFDLLGGANARWMTGDLNDDGLDEIALYHPPSSGTVLSGPRIFSLPGGAAPVEITVLAPAPFDYNAALDFHLTIPQFGDGLVVSAWIFPACPVKIMDTYKKVEDGFKFSERTYEIGENLPLPDNLANCETVLTLAEGSWPIEGAIAVMEKLAPSWPPALDLNGRPYPAGTGEALRKRLEVYMNAVSMGALESYEPCQQTAGCQMRTILSSIRLPGTPETAVRQLWDAGLATAASGVFDFNQDNIQERWFTVQHRPGETLEFWVLVQSKNDVRAVPVSLTETTSPMIYFSAATFPSPVFQLEADEGFALLFDSLGNPYIERYPITPVLTTYTRDQLILAEQELFSGVDPAAVRRRLKWTLDSGRFNCLNDRICDRFYYLLALTFELTHNSTDAVDTYIKLWWENGSSPLTTIGRLKLLFSPPASETPTLFPTATSTPTATYTPDPLISSTPTFTPTTNP